ncbi:MAG: hypothetical protein M1829_005857 [Trizodia sp. TS-e1964]|nr:MAG: hypothetical protein M1829_005857 [Trizodia sp. TS-e1964]
MSRVLIIGANRGLGCSIARHYQQKANFNVYGTTRSAPESSQDPLFKDITWIHGIDLLQSSAGTSLVSALTSLLPGPGLLSTIIINAGFFGAESFDEPDFDAELKMYTTSAIAPVFLVHHLVRSGLVAEGAKIILVSSESGSIGLRHEKEGGGNYGHHASKAALNMVGKLLSLDLKSRGIAVGIVHPGFMRTEMTKGVGFDKYYESGGAVEPDVAAASLIEFIETFNIGMTGQYWAPRGPRDIGTAEETMGKNLPTPLQLPW